MITRLIAVVTRLSQQSVENGRRPERGRQRPIEERPAHEREDGQAEEQREQRRDGGERALTPRPGRPLLDRERSTAAGSPWPPGSLDHDGGRNPRPPRIAWPSGPANQSGTRGRVGVRRRLDDDAGVGRRDVGGVGHVDRA